MSDTFTRFQDAVEMLETLKSESGVEMVMDTLVFTRGNQTFLAPQIQVPILKTMFSLVDPIIALLQREADFCEPDEDGFRIVPDPALVAVVDTILGGEDG